MEQEADGSQQRDIPTPTFFLLLHSWPRTESARPPFGMSHEPSAMGHKPPSILQASSIKQQASSINPRASSTKHHASSIKHQASSIKHSVKHYSALPSIKRQSSTSHQLPIIEGQLFNCINRLTMAMHLHGRNPLCVSEGAPFVSCKPAMLFCLEGEIHDTQPFLGQLKTLGYLYRSLGHQLAWYFID